MQTNFFLISLKLNEKAFPTLCTGAAFTFPLDPMSKHRLALAIKKEEEKKHGDNWRSCIRRKAGSTKGPPSSSTPWTHLDG